MPNKENILISLHNLFTKPTKETWENMVEAYILLSTSTGQWKAAAEKLKKTEGIKKVQRITGDYDIILLAEAEDMATLTSTIVEKIHKIEGVTDTTTAIIVG